MTGFVKRIASRHSVQMKHSPIGIGFSLASVFALRQNSNEANALDGTVITAASATST